MRSAVVDASFTAAWFLSDEATLETEAALEATASFDLWVPALWTLELGNLLISAQRRKRITEAKRTELAEVADLLRLKIDREPVAIARLDKLAALYDLTTYDAAYLELAIRRELPLATFDKALLKAMKTVSVNYAQFAK